MRSFVRANVRPSVCPSRPFVRSFVRSFTHSCFLSFLPSFLFSVRVTSFLRSIVGSFDRDVSSFLCSFVCSFVSSCVLSSPSPSLPLPSPSPHSLLPFLSPPPFEGLACASYLLSLPPLPPHPQLFQLNPAPSVFLSPALFRSAQSWGARAKNKISTRLCGGRRCRKRCHRGLMARTRKRKWPMSPQLRSRLLTRTMRALRIALPPFVVSLDCTNAAGLRGCWRHRSFARDRTGASSVVSLDCTNGGKRGASTRP